MGARGSVLAWCRFWEAESGDEAVTVTRRHAARVAELYDGLLAEWQAFAGCPQDDVESALWVARMATGEAMDLLEAVAARLGALADA